MLNKKCFTNANIRAMIAKEWESDITLCTKYYM
jgi:hypothetical protein